MKSNAVDMNPHKFLIYSNSRVKVEAWSKTISELTDLLTLRGDVVLITGPMSHNQKFHQAQLFLGLKVLNAAEDKYHAVGCLCTRALRSAGWDSKHIYFACSMDFPTDILSLVQEKGRTGRRVGAPPLTDQYLVVASFKVYVSSIKRILKPPGKDTHTHSDYTAFDDIVSLPAFQQQQLDRLHKVIELLVLPHECQQVSLERKLANPFTATNNPETAQPCGNACQYCIDSGVHPVFPRINVAGVRTVLIHLLMGPEQLPEANVETHLVQAMAAYPNANALMFGSKSAKPPTNATISRLLLMLCSAKIIIL